MDCSFDRTSSSVEFESAETGKRRRNVRTVKTAKMVILSWIYTFVFMLVVMLLVLIRHCVVLARRQGEEDGREGDARGRLHHDHVLRKFLDSTDHSPDLE